MLVLISKILEFDSSETPPSQAAFDPGIMPIASPRRVGPYNLESLPYVPAAMSAINEKG
jgi:hypothetical protein